MAISEAKGTTLKLSSNADKANDTERTIIALTVALILIFKNHFTNMNPTTSPTMIPVMILTGIFTKRRIEM